MCIAFNMSMKNLYIHIYIYYLAQLLGRGVDILSMCMAVNISMEIIYIYYVYLLLGSIAGLRGRCPE